MKKSVMIFLTATFLFSLVAFTSIPKIPALMMPTVETPNEIDLNLIVCPDGQVIIGGAFSCNASTFGEYAGAATHGTLSFNEINGKTVVTTSFRYVAPPENATDFPFNSTTVDASGEYADGLLDTNLNTTVILPPEYASQFPFNVTDFTYVEEYSNNQSTGTITVDVLSGFLLDDVAIDYSANLTDARYNGSVNVLYGMPYMDFQIDNETQLQEMLDYFNSSAIGQGPESLYNLTDGELEATHLDYSITPLTGNGGATVNFEFYIHGNFTQGMTAILQDYLGLSDKSSNITSSAYYLKSSSTTMVYSHAQKRASIQTTSTVNIDGMIEYLESTLPDMVDPEMAEPIEFLLNTTLSSAESGEFSLSYAEGVGEMACTVTVGSDLSEEVEYLTDLLLEEAPPPEQWMVDFINATKVEINNMKVSFNLSETEVSVNFEGLAVLPPVDTVNATSFKLERFFNLTGDSSFPEEGQRLGVTVIGGSNSTHKVVLQGEGSVPEPDYYMVDAEGRPILATWNNVSLSDLKELQFVVVKGAQAGGTIMNPEAVTEDNPFVIDATDEMGLHISLTKVSGKLSIVASNVTLPEGVDPQPGTLKLIGDYMQITVSNESVAVNATIRMYYTDEQIKGLDENSLALYYWDANASEWVAVSSHVNTEENYVWAVVDHFSLWAIFGEPLSPFWMQWWFIAAIIAVVAVVAAAAVLVQRRKPAAEPPLK